MYNILTMTNIHRETVIEMMRTFYNSPAVYTNGSQEIYESDVDNCISDNPYIEGYVFEKDSEIVGYGMIARSFSTEFGKSCIWIEDIYVVPQHCNRGIGSMFIDFVSEKYSDAIIRLEVEEDNERAVHVYKKKGFEVLPYMEMKK